ncbi:MAG: type II toxin-antitoxin system antitoxin SocA domain-containing protein, partial [Anaerolineae bacterium]
MTSDITQKLQELIRHVVSEVTDLGGYPTTLRLHKYLYLIDLEHWRRHGRTLTRLNWDFHHYGPYAPALAEVGRTMALDLDTEEFTTASGHDGRLFTVPFHSAELTSYSYAQKMMIDGLLQIWADQDT